MPPARLTIAMIKTSRNLALLSASLWLAVSAPARINVETVPDRDSVQLTIYNSVDLTMVRETRFLTLRKGVNHLEFSWVNTLIDPTSVEFKALSHADEVEVLDASFPPRVTNTLEWRVHSEFSGEVKVEIRYFTSGISWSAGYVAEANREEKLADLAGYVKVNNQSGEDYENAQIRLVVGVIKLVEEIARLAQSSRLDKKELAPVALADLDAAARRPISLAFDLAVESKKAEIVKEGLSEYFLYTVGGRDTIANGWSKRLSSFEAPGVPLVSYYKFEKERWGDQVMRYYRFKNDKESKLGDEPLPNGDVEALRRVTGDNLHAFVGQTRVKYIPINETVEMELGDDQEVLVKPMLTDWRKDDIRFARSGGVAGWAVTESWQIETQNSKDVEVTLDIRRNFHGAWRLNTESAYEKVDANQIKFLFKLKPREKRVLTYELVTRKGLNAGR